MDADSITLTNSERLALVKISLLRQQNRDSFTKRDLETIATKSTLVKMLGGFVNAGWLERHPYVDGHSGASLPTVYRITGSPPTSEDLLFGA